MSGHLGVALVLHFAGTRSQTLGIVSHQFLRWFRWLVSKTLVFTSTYEHRNYEFPSVFEHLMKYEPNESYFRAKHAVFTMIYWHPLQNHHFLQWKSAMIRPGVNLFLNHPFLRWLMRAVSKTSVFYDELWARHKWHVLTAWEGSIMTLWSSAEVHFR